MTDAASGAFYTFYRQFTKGMTEAVNNLDGMSRFPTKAASALSPLIGGSPGWVPLPIYEFPSER